MFRQSRNEHVCKTDEADSDPAQSSNCQRTAAKFRQSRNQQRARRAGETCAQYNSGIGSNSPTTKHRHPSVRKNSTPSAAVTTNTTRFSLSRERQRKDRSASTCCRIKSFPLCPPNDKPFLHFPLISNTTSTPGHFSFTISEQTSNARRDKRPTKTRSPP